MVRGSRCCCPSIARCGWHRAALRTYLPVAAVSPLLVLLGGAAIIAVATTGNGVLTGLVVAIVIIAMLLAALVLLIGCSLRKIGYNLAPRFVVSRLSSTFDLNKAQKQQAQVAVAGLHSWHRQNELPRYVEFLDAILKKTADGLTREEVLWMLSEGERTWERAVQKVAPEMAGRKKPTFTAWGCGFHSLKTNAPRGALVADEG